MNENERYITRYGLEKLIENLNELELSRPAYLEDVVSARDVPGDDNHEITSAVEIVEVLDSKIREITHIIDACEVYVSLNKEHVEFGDRVSLMSEDGKEISYKIVGTNEIGFCANSGCMSVMSPIAQSVLGRKIDDEVDIQMPSGDFIYSITKIVK